MLSAARRVHLRYQGTDSFLPVAFADHAALQRRLRTPVCLDESIHSPKDAALAIASGACRIVNVKPGRVGGFAESIRVHDACAAAGVPVWHGGMLESGIGRAQNIHLATLPNFTLPGDIAASRRYYAEDLIEPGIEVSADGTTPEPGPAGTAVTSRPPPRHSGAGSARAGRTCGNCVRSCPMDRCSRTPCSSGSGGAWTGPPVR